MMIINDDTKHYNNMRMCGVYNYVTSAVHKQEVFSAVTTSTFLQQLQSRS